MKKSVDFKIGSIFSECGIKLVNSNTISNEIILPNKKDMETMFSFHYYGRDENTIMNLISNFIFEKNYFRIPDWNCFLPDFNANNQEAISLKYIFEYTDIRYQNRNLNCVFPYEIYKHLELLMKNKDFLKLFSTETQLKGTFTVNEYFLLKLKIEFGHIIVEKLLKSGFTEKADIEFPKFIMKHLEQNLYK